MSDILPPIPSAEPNKRKLIFIGIISALLFVIVAFFVFMSGWAGKTAAGKGFDPVSKQVTLWTVGLDTKIFVDLNTAFNTYLGRSDIKLDVQNFASFDDYIDMIPRVIQSGKAPDMILVPNHGGYLLFDQYINSIDDTTVDFTDFETRFHKLFFEELVYSETIKGDGQDRIVKWLRGVPFGFEPLGIYYNRELVEKVPTLWSKLQTILKAPVVETTPLVETEDDTVVSAVVPKVTTPIEQPAFINLGYGKVTPASADILALLTVQKKWPLLATYTSVNATDSRAIFDYYLSFRRAPNNLSRFDAQFAETLTTTDLFVRGKIATLIGYPSTYQDIKIAIQRARQESELAPDFLKNLRVATVPQEEIDPKKQINFAKYMYFALTKNGTNRDTKKPQNDPVLKFVQFLLTKEAQDTFAKHPTYLLPAQNATLTGEGDMRINPEADFAMTVADWYVAGQSFALYDMGIPHLFRDAVKQALDEPGTTASTVTSFVSSYLACKVGQLTDPTQYSHACLCRTTLPVNRNNYWPLCGQE